jgi:hypothetical protein
MKCKSCGVPIYAHTAIPEGYCNECVKKTNELLAVLDKMIPYEG